ncbi:MAG: hypothetical protein K0Q93_944 [Nocardioidaceae bacterium]|nr:hypothetical protein [Nocardioidaceae bacterium]
MRALMRSLRPVRVGRAGAIYDLITTVGFATPWTATLVLGGLADVHDKLGLAGDPMPTFETSHLLFVILFGVIVTLWSVVRIMWPVPLLIAADTVGRAAFCTFFIWSLLHGHSAVVVAFLIPEVSWLIAQALGVRKALKDDRDGVPVPALVAA